MYAVRAIGLLQHHQQSTEVVALGRLSAARISPVAMALESYRSLTIGLVPGPAGRTNRSSPCAKKPACRAERINACRALSVCLGETPTSFINFSSAAAAGNVKPL